MIIEDKVSKIGQFGTPTCSRVSPDSGTTMPEIKELHTFVVKMRLISTQKIMELKSFKIVILNQILDEFNKNGLVFDHFRVFTINLGCSCIDFLYFFIWL